MKNLMKSIRITLVFCIFLSVCYILVLWIFAQFAAPGEKGNAETVKLNGKVVGVANVGQVFTKDIFFWGRPSCAGTGYDGTSSAGSNKGATNEEYLAEVKTRIDSFLDHPYLKRKDVPAEMVTASASGLDPDITPECAYVQIKRVAEARGMQESDVKAIVDKMIEQPLLGIFGPAKINVLKLNVAMEEANPTIDK